MRRLTILGLDAGDPGLLLEWAHAGELPALRSLLARGSHRPIGGPGVLGASGTWLSLMSGASLAEHGYYLRRPLKPGTYRLERLDPSATGATPFWADLRGTGRRAVIVDVPDGFLVPGVEGAQVVDWATHPTPPALRCLPGGLAATLAARHGPRARSDERTRGRAGNRRVLRRLLDGARRKGELCAELMREQAPELTVAVFGESHAAGHRFHRYREAGDAELGNAILDVYRAIDRELGRLIAASAQADVVLLSNGGIATARGIDELTEWFGVALGFERRVPRRPARALDAWRSAAPARFRAVLDPLLIRAAGGRYASTDWRETRAFAIPSDYLGLIRVNLRGREPSGTVAPRDYDGLLDEIERELRALTAADTGLPAVCSVTRAARVFPPGPPDKIPDLFVEWSDALGARPRIVHPRVSFQPPRPALARANRHTALGLMIAAGPSFRERGALPTVAPVELASLFRALLDGAPGARAAGHSAA